MSVGQQVDVCGGVDTHRDVHMAVVVDSTGRVLGTAPFRADTAGYQQLGDWLGSHGRVVRVGIEGTGSYGAGLARYLTEAGVEVTEVNRPNRQLRRRLGKTDATDAQGAARAVLNGQATAVPKSGNGRVEAIRMLSVARRSATKARTQAINQLHALVVTAPDQVKHQLGGLSPKARVKACAGFRSRTATITVTYAKKALRSLARRYQALTAEIEELTTQINHLCAQVNPALLAASGVGADTAAALLVAAGDNPERMQSEASFAALCGEKSRPGVVGTDHTPPSQSGRQPPSQQCPVADRHHPHGYDQTTIAYTQKRQTEGKNRREIIRCLKRHIARQIYHLLTNPPETPNGAHLRCLRKNALTTLTHAATALQTYPARLSQLERGIYHNHQLATRYHQWLTTLTPHQNSI